MSKAILFGVLWWITGNPIVALLLLLVLIYILDRRFIGFMPNLLKPLQLSKRLRKAREELALNPHNASLKLEVARILVEKRRYREASELLDGIIEVMDDSAEVWFESGLCKLKLGDLAEGERRMQKALSLNPRVRYGEPYLRLGEAFADHERDKALDFLHKFRDVQTSSCEAYYRLGSVLHRMGRGEEAKKAWREAVEIYRALPKYKRKSERRWAYKAMMKR